METINIKGNLTALSPIHHGGSEDYGTTRLIHQQPAIIINPETGTEEIDNIPCIHGNSIRGYLRRLIMDDLFTLLDYELDSKKIYHFLFTGGLLEAVNPADKGAINLSLKKKLRKLIPPLSLLGSAIGNQMFEGKLKVDLLFIVCAETKHYLTDYTGYAPSIYNLRSLDFGTRLDDLKGDYTEEQEESGQHHQMKYEFETLIQGTKFTHEFTLEDCNSVEKACFTRMISLWEERPYIGGKSGIGYGKVKLDYPQLTEWSDIDYLNFIHENKDEIISLLDDLVKTWK